MKFNGESENHVFEFKKSNTKLPQIKYHGNRKNHKIYGNFLY